MNWYWSLLALLVILAGLRYGLRRRTQRRSGGVPRVDDAALGRILQTGSLPGDDDDDEPLDPEAAARAEEEFWQESWDEPEEYSS